MWSWGAYGMKKGFFDQEIKAYKEVIKINPKNAEAHFWLGAAYFLLNKRENALDEYKILKELDKDLANKLFDYISK